LQATNWSNNGITRQGLEKLVTHLNQCNHVNELNLPDLNPERLPVFPGGVAIVYATFKSLGIEQMTVADGALREGLIQDLLGRIYDHDMRSATVQSVADRYRTDKKHAARIKQTINFILKQLSANCSWPDDENCAQFLDWAADLHEIGIDIAHSNTISTAPILLKMVIWRVFSTQDQILLAAIIRSIDANFRQLFSTTYRHLGMSAHLTWLLF